MMHRHSPPPCLMSMWRFVFTTTTRRSLQNRDHRRHTASPVHHSNDTIHAAVVSRSHSRNCQPPLCATMGRGSSEGHLSPESSQVSLRLHQFSGVAISYVPVP
ncbi:unnamed protein product [Brassica rapa]|uniref:Uncharacterized protein n=1 Tax=Brassica campestris TaxID=3711 RepID=A0A3P6A0N7_BRACM|nr:unnamed protein product [Brassica rapa]VDC85657.1 unnamed protein product [Brassica rapa]